MQKDWSNFYTPMPVASEIINFIPHDYQPTCLVDICSGSGNFLNAALSKWNADVVAIDLMPQKSITSYKVHNVDALDLNNLKFLKEVEGKLLLANPPFGKLADGIKNLCSKHSQLQEEAIKLRRVETNMLVSNMSILNDGEIFAAVLPENIFTSKKFVNFKLLFLSHFEILHLGKARRYFPGSEVQTRIFIGSYKSNSVNQIRKSKSAEKQYNFKAIRGIDNSKLIKSKSDVLLKNFVKVIHFSNVDAKLHLKCSVPENSYSFEKVIEKNDYLIARVGRQSGMVYKPKVEFIGNYASDYFYIIKNADFLKNSELRKKAENILLEKVAGMTAKYLCKSDIMSTLELIRQQAVKTKP